MARPQPGASSIHLLPKSRFGFHDNDAAILRCPNSHRYVIACLRNVVFNDERLFRFQLYDSKTGGWSTRQLRLDSSERDTVLPIPNTATEVLFHDTTKVITPGGPNGTVCWVDLWRGIIFCNVLDENPVLRDMPLPKPSRKNRRNFCQGCPLLKRDITVACQEQDIKVIKYVEMETRRGDVLSSHGSESDYDSDDEVVAYYWKATIWTMQVPISSSWKDWHKVCTADVTDIVIDILRHSELLLPLPRHTAAYPTLGLGMDDDAIYFLSETDAMDPSRWVMAVNMRSGKLNGVAELHKRKNLSFRRYHVPSEISKYLIKATGN
jgi:hypothetical protein